ncbi:hypothetical protein [Nonomuraea sp. NPDC049646]|uniref:hypothetical protein n=1 Tax=unclassified Nonomuraea TaxID=2593643 RepID=UPI003798ED67
MTATPQRWALYARAADMNGIRAQLAEMRAFVEGETDGMVVAECSDLGQPGSGLQALFTLAKASAVEQVAVVKMQAFGASEPEMGDAIVKIGKTGAGLSVLASLREVLGTPVPDQLEQQVRDVFTSAGIGPDELGEHAPTWYHDGQLSLLRRQLRAAHADLDNAEADGPPGFGVPPAVMRARIAAAQAEQAFAERLMEVARGQA